MCYGFVDSPGLSRRPGIIGRNDGVTMHDLGQRFGVSHACGPKLPVTIAHTAQLGVSARRRRGSVIRLMI